MKSLAYLFMVLLAVTAGAQAASITVDGDISDWPTSAIFVDPTDDNAAPKIDITRWGAYSDGVNLYAFMELNADRGYQVNDFLTANKGRLYVGLWIDADNSNATAINNITGENLDWPADHSGVDVNLEWGIKTGGNEYYFWGAGDDVDNEGSSWATNGAYAYDGYIVEFSCPLADLATELESYPDGVVLGNQFKVAIVSQGYIDHGGAAVVNYGNDLTTPELITVPEPVSVVLLALGALCLRRKS